MRHRTRFPALPLAAPLALVVGLVLTLAGTSPALADRPQTGGRCREGLFHGHGADRPERHGPPLLQRPARRQGRGHRLRLHHLHPGLPGARAEDEASSRKRPAIGSGDDVVLLSISVDPETDTPAKLRAFGAQYGARDGWYFLTGSRENVSRVLAKLGFAVDDKESHSTIVLMGNEQTGLWKKTNGLASSGELVKLFRTVLDDDGSAGAGDGAPAQSGGALTCGAPCAPSAALPARRARRSAPPSPAGNRGAPRSGLTPQEARGKQLYLSGESPSGEPVTALMGDAGIEVPATALPCSSCHGRDGRGPARGRRGAVRPDLERAHPAVHRDHGGRSRARPVHRAHRPAGRAAGGRLLGQRPRHSHAALPAEPRGRRRPRGLPQGPGPGPGPGGGGRDPHPRRPAAAGRGLPARRHGPDGADGRRRLRRPDQRRRRRLPPHAPGTLPAGPRGGGGAAGGGARVPRERAGLRPGRLVHRRRRPGAGRPGRRTRQSPWSGR